MSTAQRDPAPRPPGLLPARRRGAADRPHPRDHRPLRAVGARRSSTSPPSTRVLAPDLLGHGESAKPRGDYSLGAYASAVRDTIVALGHDRATIVGHSLGGGIAMQFAYQFPERCERLVLVSSGGLGPRGAPAAAAATLPGSEWVMPWLMHARGARRAARRSAGLVGVLRLQAGTDLAEVARGFASLGDAEARDGVHRDDARRARPGRPARQRARPALPGRGAAVADRLGRRPTRSSRPTHGRAAHELMPGSRLEILDGVGHFPQLERPHEFAALLAEFIADDRAGRARHVDDARAPARPAASASARARSARASGSARPRGRSGPRPPRSSRAGTSPAARRRRAGAGARARRGPRAGRARGGPGPRTASRPGG